MEEDDGLDLKLQGTFVSCVVAVWEWLTVLDLQKQHCWGSRSTECGTSSIELTFYLNFKAISSSWGLLWPLYPSFTTEQQMQLVIKTHKQLLSVVRLQWRNIFCIEVVTCLKNSVCSKTPMAISLLYPALFYLWGLSDSGYLELEKTLISLGFWQSFWKFGWLLGWAMDLRISLTIIACPILKQSLYWENENGFQPSLASSFLS